MTRSITTSFIKIIPGALACAFTCLALTTARAVPVDPTVTLAVDPNFPPGTTPYVLGNVIPPVPASAAFQALYINTLIPLGLGGSATVSPNPGSLNTAYRSDNSFASLPPATIVGDKSGGPSSFVLPTGFQYLAAQYDGPDGALSVWDIASLAPGTTIDLPRDAYGPNDDEFPLAGWRLFNPTTGEVPDGGSSILLLGIGLLGLCLMHRYLFQGERSEAGNAN